MSESIGRRAALLGLGTAAVGFATAGAARERGGADGPSNENEVATLEEFSSRLRKAPRRRDFKSVPMILDHPDLWDAVALNEVIKYRGERKQVWDNKSISGPWLNLMRNSVNAQIYSFRHDDFLAVSATHGTAHLALFDQPTWDKYQLAKLAGDKFRSNTLITGKDAESKQADFQDPKSIFGASGDTIPTLQSRGVVFLACHNAIWELTGKILKQGTNPDHKSHEEVAAELTNHLIEGVVLTPGIVATIPELQHAGYDYAAS